MLQFSLGDDFSLVDTKPTVASRLKQVASRITTRAEVAPISTGGCLPGDAMSEFGCITPKVRGPNYSAMNSYYVCPPYSTPYNDQWCLRQAVPKGFEYQPTQQATQVVQQQPEQQPEISHQAVEPEPGVMTMYVCADGTRVGDPSLCPFTPAEGTEPSPGMQTEPAPSPPETPTVQLPPWDAGDERKRWMKWATIGAVVIGAGVVAAVLRR